MTVNFSKSELKCYRSFCNNNSKPNIHGHISTYSFCMWNNINNNWWRKTQTSLHANIYHVIAQITINIAKSIQCLLSDPQYYCCPAKAHVVLEHSLYLVTAIHYRDIMVTVRWRLWLGKYKDKLWFSKEHPNLMARNLKCKELVAL